MKTPTEQRYPQTFLITRIMYFPSASGMNLHVASQTQIAITVYACAVPSIEQQQMRRLVRLVVALTKRSGNKKALFLIHDPLRIDIGTHIHHNLLATGVQPDITETSGLETAFRRIRGGNAGWWRGLCLSV